MFPAPTTSATSTPLAATSWTCAAIRSTRWGSVPYSSGPINASPESFRRMRLNVASGIAGKIVRASDRVAGSFLADREAGEAGDADVLTRLRGELGPERLDRLPLVAIGSNVLLLEQRDLPGPLRELAVDDPLDDGVGLSLLARLRLEHEALGLPDLLGDLIRGHVRGRRRRPGDVDRHLPGELLKLVAPGDEIGLALHLDQHPHLSRGVDVRGDDALAGGPAASLGSRRLALDAEDLDRLLDVAAGLGERRLAVHDPGAGALAKRLDVRRGDRRHHRSLFPASRPRGSEGPFKRSLRGPRPAPRPGPLRRSGPPRRPPRPPGAPSPRPRGAPAPPPPDACARPPRPGASPRRRATPERLRTRPRRPFG